MRGDSARACLALVEASNTLAYRVFSLIQTPTEYRDLAQFLRGKRQPALDFLIQAGFQLEIYRAMQKANNWAQPITALPGGRAHVTESRMPAQDRHATHCGRR